VARVSSSAPMSDDGEEQLLHVFRRIDLHNNGKVRLEEIVPVAKDLGIRCSKNTLKKVFQRVDPDGVGTIDLEKFKTLYAQVSTPERVKALLPEASASFLDYRNSVEQDPSFAKHFPMPQSFAATLKYQKHFHATVEAVRWVADGSFLAATSEGKLVVYDTGNHEDVPVKKCNIGSSLYCMDAFAGGRGVLVGLGKKKDNLLLWNMAEEQVLQRFTQDGPIFSCCLGKEVAIAGSNAGHIAMHDIETAACVASWPLHEAHVTSLKMEQDGQRAISTSRDGQVVVFDLNNASTASCVICKLEDAAAAYAVCDALWCGQYEILTGGDDFCVKRWDIRKPGAAPLSRYMGHTSCVRSLAISPDKKLFVSGATDSSIRLWALSPADVRGALTTESGASSTDLIADLIARRDQVIELVHAGEGDLAEVRELTNEIEHLKAKLGPAVGSDDGIIDVHGNIRAVLGFSGHSLAVGTLAWQSAGHADHRLVSGAQDEFVHLFEFSNGQVMSGMSDMSRQCSAV